MAKKKTGAVVRRKKIENLAGIRYSDSDQNYIACEENNNK